MALLTKKLRLPVGRKGFEPSGMSGIGPVMESFLGLGGGLGAPFIARSRSHVDARSGGKVLSECLDRAKEIAWEWRADAKRLAHALRDKVKLTGAEVREIVDGQPWPQLVSQAS